ncbi:Protein of unknown function [Cotesia congregata]|uniref:Uncharacterized protein n=1 Tax=Cotesia congregata TaxID=51543 RepID=A0A8J2HED9_COTCN|nr:Protein of unknown function [Cotesia congregata]
MSMLWHTLNMGLIVILIHFNSENRKNNSDNPDQESNPDPLVTHQGLFQLNCMRHRLLAKFVKLQYFP